MSKRGVREAAVTAKDKLRKIIGHGLNPENAAIFFSSERIAQCTKAAHGIENVEKWIGRPAPQQYSADLSTFVRDAGVRSFEENMADLFYLTLSDFIQHHYAPGSPEADDFMKGFDERVCKLIGLGAIIALTGDHGMSDKCNADAIANVLFPEDTLSTKFGDNFRTSLLSDHRHLRQTPQCSGSLRSSPSAQKYVQPHRNAEVLPLSPSSRARARRQISSRALRDASRPGG